MVSPALLSVVSGSDLFSMFGANMIFFTVLIERHRSGLVATVIYDQLAKNAAKICLVIKWQTKTYSDAIASLGLHKPPIVRLCFSFSIFTV